MICKNAKQMLLTATRNSVMMHRQGYTYETSPYMIAAKSFWVTKPERDEDGNPVVYNVTLNPPTCSCKFFTDHRAAGYQLGECTCKHVEWMRENDAENSRVDAMVAQQEERDAAELDAINFLTESRANRGYFDMTGHTPCHLPTPKATINMGAADLVHVLMIDHADRTISEAAQDWNLPAPVVAMFYKAVDGITEHTH